MKAFDLKRAFEGLGLTVEYGGKSLNYTVKAKNHYTTWWDQDGLAICVCVTRNGEVADAQRDYFPGHIAKTIKQAVAWTLGG